MKGERGLRRGKKVGAYSPSELVQGEGEKMLFQEQ